MRAAKWAIVGFMVLWLVAIVQSSQYRAQPTTIRTVQIQVLDRLDKIEATIAADLNHGEQLARIESKIDKLLQAEQLARRP